jgi:hypothetical protein
MNHLPLNTPTSARSRVKFRPTIHIKQKCLKKGPKVMPEASKEELQEEEGKGEGESKTINEKQRKKLKELVLPNDSNVAKGNT